MQVSFVAMAAAQNRVKVTTRLQALTLLDNKFSKVRTPITYIDRYQTHPPLQAASASRLKSVDNRTKTAVRRKVGYFKEDDEDEREHKKSRKVGGNRSGEDATMN